jgi:hypothetical protein
MSYLIRTFHALMYTGFCRSAPCIGGAFRMRQKRCNHHNKNRGAALIMALSLLGLFVALGTLYIRHMTLEIDRSNIQQRQLRARLVAESGFHAALADLTQALNEGQVHQRLGKTYTYEFPVYEEIASLDSGFQGQVEGNRLAVAEVTVLDESGKVNINHAPASVIQSLLDIDGETARAIVGGLPGRPGADENGAWYLRLDDLVTRGYLSREDFNSIDTSLLTTFTVINHEQPVEYLNINAAPVEVLAAVFALSLEEAEAFAVKRPIGGANALYTAIDKDPATFNYRPEVNTESIGLPEALTLESRCFRIIVEGRYALLDPTGNEKEYQVSYGQVEAIVLFNRDDDDDDDDYVVLYWNTHRDRSA